jgi:hypothetical protein
VHETIQKNLREELKSNQQAHGVITKHTDEVKRTAMWKESDAK